MCLFILYVSSIGFIKSRQNKDDISIRSICFTYFKADMRCYLLIVAFARMRRYDLAKDGKSDGMRE